MVVCCGGHLLVLAALGGLAVGTVVGVLGGVLAATLLIAVVVVMRRRRAGLAAMQVPGVVTDER